MKPSFSMSLVLFVLTFWSSYLKAVHKHRMFLTASSPGSPGYVDDQVLKYCKAFANKFNIAIDEYESTIKGGLFRVDRIWLVGEWTCQARNIKKRKLYTVWIEGDTIESTDLSDEDIIRHRYDRVLKMHQYGHKIPVGSVEYITWGLFKNLLYVAITAFKSETLRLPEDLPTYNLK